MNRKRRRTLSIGLLFLAGTTDVAGDDRAEILKGIDDRQGLLVAALFWGVRHFIKTSNARYVAACCALAAMVAMPVTTLVATMPSPSDPVVVWTEPMASRSPVPVISRELSEIYRPDARPLRTDSPDLWRRLSGHFRRNLPAVVLYWQIGVLLLSLRLVGGSWVSQRLKKSGTQALPAEWQARVSLLLKRLNIRHRVDIVTSSVATIPMVVGVIGPWF